MKRGIFYCGAFVLGGLSILFPSLGTAPRGFDHDPKLVLGGLPRLIPSLENGFAQEPEGVKRKVQKTNAEWAKLLTREQFQVTRLKATEPAFSGKYANSHAKGTFTCVCCGAELFSSATKFESGTGWPSFYEPINEKRIDSATDYDLGYARIEVMCQDCGAHLGHVFDDGPPPTGLRYCINSASLKLVTKAAVESKKAGKAKAKTSKAKSDSKATKEKEDDKDKPEPEATSKP